MITVNASNLFAAPLVLYPYEWQIPPEIAADFPKDWVMGKSAKGYQMSQTFYNYISGPFIEFLRKNNVLLPIILSLDGHKSHLTLDLGQYCRENGIAILCLPPNCTHFAPPLD